MSIMEVPEVDSQIRVSKNAVKNFNKFLRTLKNLLNFLCEHSGMLLNATNKRLISGISTDFL